MPHWRTMVDSQWLRAIDLNGREVTVEIESVVGGQVTGEGGKTNRKPVLRFRGKDKPMAIGATIGKTIEAMYGPNTEGWIGKMITLYTSTTQVGGEERPCIRVRPRIPNNGRVSTSRPAPGPGDGKGAGYPVDDEDAINRRNAAPTADEMPE